LIFLSVKTIDRAAVARRRHATRFSTKTQKPTGGCKGVHKNKINRPPTKNMTKTEVLLERLGGQKALRAAVDEFYLRLTGDKELARFFEGVNVKLLKWHQVRLNE
jgi:hypothetical protein